MAVDRRMVLAGMAASVLPVDAAVALDPPAVSLVAEEGRLSLRDKVETHVWGYNGQVPGPLIRVKKGAELRVDLHNKLGQPTSLCWHGVRIANAMDGVAGLTQQPVMPGDTFEYRFVPPDSGTYWYHPHVWPYAAEQIGRGLYGVLIVDEPEAPAVDDDLLVVLDDWALDEKGIIKNDFLDPSRTAGSLLTINSKAVPERRSVRPGARLRLRLLNACGARIAVVSFVGSRATVIAIDGQPSEIFEPAHGVLPIGPGSRFDVLVDMPSRSPASLMLLGDGVPDQPLLIFDVTGPALSSRGGVAKLPDNPLLPTRIHLEKSLRRSLTIATKAGAPPSWTLDGQASDGFSGSPLFTVKHGGAVTLTFMNQTTDAQQMHVHGHAFRLLHDLDDGWDPYWRDSVLLAPGKTKHVAFIADNPGRWAVESLTLVRQVTGLAGYFVVR